MQSYLVWRERVGSLRSSHAPKAPEMSRQNRHRSPSRKPIQTGLDALVADRFRQLKGRKVGLLVNAASIDGRRVHAIERFRGAAPDVELVRLFGPRYGVWGEMVDRWEGFSDPATGLDVVSLCDADRKPTAESLAGIDALVIDLPEVGARCHTFLWTATLCLQACRAAGVEAVVLDRPNPLGGLHAEGPGVDEGFESFVGLHSLPLRHGFSMGEALRWVAERIGAGVRVVEMRGWGGRHWFDRTGLPWVMPAPDLPTGGSLAVFPGMALVEGTSLSVGKGTARPYEIFGAPWIDGRRLVSDLRKADLPGAHFRACRFTPGHDRHSGELCGGAQIEVLDRERFHPARAGVAVIAAALAQSGEGFWCDPPLEGEGEKMPIDLLSGGGDLRAAIDAGAGWREVARGWEQLEEAWRMERLEYFLYNPL